MDRKPNRCQKIQSFLLILPQLPLNVFHSENPWALWTRCVFVVDENICNMHGVCGFRISVVVLVGVSILWIPVIQSSQDSQLFVYIQQVSAFLQPPICATFLLAIFWHRLNEQVRARPSFLSCVDKHFLVRCFSPLKVAKEVERPFCMEKKNRKLKHPQICACMFGVECPWVCPSVCKYIIYRFS